MPMLRICHSSGICPLPIFVLRAFFFSSPNRIPSSEGRGAYVRACGWAFESLGSPLSFGCLGAGCGHYLLASCPLAGWLSCLGTIIVIECVLGRRLPVRRLDMEDSLILQT